MRSWVTATQRYFTQNIVTPVRYVIRKKMKLGAVWRMKTWRISPPVGRNGAERSTGSFRVFT